MSNFSRAFEDNEGDRFGGRGGRRGGGRGGGNRRDGDNSRGNDRRNRDEPIDAKHQRKPVLRKAIDFNILIMHDLQERMLYRDYRDRPTLEPSSDSIRSLPSLITDVSHNPSLGLCTKYITLAVNQSRAPITVISWSPDGRRLLSASHTGEFTQWNGQQFNFEGIVAAAHDDPVRAMTWSNNQLLMLTADEGGVIKYWQSSLNNLKAFKAHKEPVRDLSFAPNDIHFVSCSDDQTASIWDLETSKEVVCLKGHGWDVKASKWHPSKGIIITGGKDQLIKLWDPRAGAGGTNHGRNEHCLADIHAHKNTVNKLAWCPTNPNWFLSGSRDNLVKCFDIRTMKDFQTGRSHKKEITSLAWHPTIERLYGSGSYDGTILQWFIGETEPQAEITGAHDSAVNGLQWHPLGHLLASASNDHTTRFWARNRPGDDMTDKYNVASLPAAQKAVAMSVLVEAAQRNPSKYSRLPAALAEHAQQSQIDQQEQQNALAASIRSSDMTTDTIPGMGIASSSSLSSSSITSSYVPPGMMGIKREPQDTKTSIFDNKLPTISSHESKPIYSVPLGTTSSNPATSGTIHPDRLRRRSRSRSREREHRSDYRNDNIPPPNNNNPNNSNTRFAPPPPALSPHDNRGPAAGYNSFFPGSSPPHQQQQQQLPPPQQHQQPPQQQQRFPPPPQNYQMPPPQNQNYPPPQYSQQHPHQQQGPPPNYPPHPSHNYPLPPPQQQQQQQQQPYRR